MKNLFIKKGWLFVVALTLIVSIPMVTSAALTTTLRLGSRGAEVTELQTFLAQDSTIYPQGLVTGYFGSLTRAAVIRFQSRNGLGADGIVGPITRAAINARLGGGAPMISSVSINASRNSAVINWNTNELAQGKVYYSAAPLTTYEYENAVDVSGTVAMTDMTSRMNQSVSLTNLQPNTQYYYLIYVTDQSGLISVTWPATFMTTN